MYFSTFWDGYQVTSWPSSRACGCISQSKVLFSLGNSYICCYGQTAVYCFDSCLTSVRCAITHLAFALINWMKKEAVATKSLLRLLALGNKLHSVLISLCCYTNMSHKQSKASTFQFLHFTAELVSGFCPGTKDKHGYSSRPMLNSCKRAFQKDVFP